MFLSIISFLALVISLLVYLFFAIKLTWKLTKKLFYCVCYPFYENQNLHSIAQQDLMGEVKDPLFFSPPNKVTNLKELLHQQSYKAAAQIATALAKKKP